MGAVAPHLRKESSSYQARVTDHELINTFHFEDCCFCIVCVWQKKTKLAADVGADAALIYRRVFTAWSWCKQPPLQSGVAREQRPTLLFTQSHDSTAAAGLRFSREMLYWKFDVCVQVVQVKVKNTDGQRQQSFFSWTCWLCTVGLQGSLTL